MFDRAKAFANREPALAAHALYLAAAAVTLGGAWYLQLVGGLWPCPLCLEQREPWYAGIMISAIVLFVPYYSPAMAHWRLRGLAPLMALTLWGLYKAGEHIGIEHGWWGSGCTAADVGGGPATIEDLMSGSAADTAVPCDAIQWEFWGITLAGYNFLIQALLLAAMVWLFWKGWKAQKA